MLPIAEIITRTISKILVGAARLGIRHGVPYQTFAQITKAAFVRAASEEAWRAGKIPNASVLSLMTGLQRRDPAILANQNHSFGQTDGSHLVTAIIGRWLTDRRFCSPNGKPKVLDASGRNSEFAKLVRLVSSDPNVYTVLFEMERLRLIQRSEDTVELIAMANDLRGEIESGFLAMGDDVADLMATVQENLLSDGRVPLHHCRTEFDNIPPESLPKIRLWLLKHGERVHAEVLRFLAKHDRDITGEPHDSSAPRGSVAFKSFAVIKERDDLAHERSNKGKRK